jgi:hypothetical protein
MFSRTFVQMAPIPTLPTLKPSHKAQTPSKASSLLQVIPSQPVRILIIGDIPISKHPTDSPAHARSLPARSSVSHFRTPQSAPLNKWSKQLARAHHRSPEQVSDGLRHSWHVQISVNWHEKARVSTAYVILIIECGVIFPEILRFITIVIHTVSDYPSC